MKYIKTDYNIPYYNMALEEYLMGSDKHRDDYVFFYIHRPSVIIGRHQNAYAEVNSGYIKEHGIIVSRRISGGGAVYHDEGNLNFSFITNAPGGQVVDFRPYIEPVVRALRKVGVTAALTGRNDLCIGERKFSGNAQYIASGKVLHHGTLMFDVNVENMLNALNVSEMKISSKAVESVRSRVINLNEYLPESMDILDFKQLLLDTFFEGDHFGEYVLTDEDKNAVERLVEVKFSKESYNFGTPRPFAVVKKRKFKAGIVEISFNVKGNVFIDFCINGDFFCNKDIDGIGEYIKGCEFSESAVSTKLSELDFDSYISNFTKEEMLELIFA